ncbi:MAG: tetratricopeptide repeat protein [Rhodocyclaceae bacterium]|nr:tetratricopeptide repeat protein [Rhodocyclaceae bacterium]
MNAETATEAPSPRFLSDCRAPAGRARPFRYRGLRLVLTLALLPLAPGLWAAQTSATTSGACSAAFAQVDVKGNLTINNQCGLSEKAVEDIRRTLTTIGREQKLSVAQMSSLAQATNIMLGVAVEQLGQMGRKLDEQSESIKALTRSVTELSAGLKANPNADLAAEAQQWKQRYEDLLKQWQVVQGSDPRDEDVRQALAGLDLDKAGRLLDQLLAEQGKAEDVFAARYYRRAQVFLLQFDRPHALPLLQKAYGLRPDNENYAFELANAWQEQNAFAQAEAVYQDLLPRLRARAQDNPAAYRPDVATTLNNLGVLYADTGRLAEAEKAYGEALDIYRGLARDNPAAYRPYVARTLNNLGILYRDTGRLAEAEKAFGEALDIQRALYRAYPAAHVQRLRVMLRGLATVFAQQHRDPERAHIEQEIAALGPAQ